MKVCNCRSFFKDAFRNNHQKPLDEAKETLDRLLRQFNTGEIVGRRLRLALEHIKKQIIIAEQEQDQNINKY